MKKITKRVGSAIVALTIILSLCGSAFATVHALRFSDTMNHWAKEIIETLAEKEVVSGFPDGTCRPDKLITRGEFSALIARYFCYEPTGNIDGFSDVKGHWAEASISGIAGAGVITSTEYNGAFVPDGFMNRMEMVTMIVRSLGLEELALADKTETIFADDKNIAKKDKGYLNVANKLGIVKGFGDKTVRPYSNVTRAEAFVMFYRMIEADTAIQNISANGQKLTLEELLEKVQEELKILEAEKNEAGKALVPEKDPVKNEGTTDKSNNNNSGSGSTSRPSGGGGGIGSYVPTPAISLELPETAYTGIAIPVTATSSNAKTVVWTLTKGGATVSDATEKFTAKGGELVFNQTGSYTLKAVATNSRGKSSVVEKSVTVYPVAGLAFTIPAVAYTDTAIPIELVTENVADGAVSWTIEENGKEVALSEVANGGLSHAGGVLQFTKTGTFTIVASATDVLGKATICSQKVMIYPVAAIAIDIPETTHIDKTVQLKVTKEFADKLTVEWSATKDGEAINMAEYISGTLDSTGGEICFTQAGGS